MIHEVVVKLEVTQRTRHDVAAQTVGIFHGCTPVILLDKLFAVAVLALHQVERSIGSRAHHRFRFVGRNARKHHGAVVHQFVVNQSVGVFKVARAQNVRLFQTIHQVGIQKAPINNRNRHSFSRETRLMQLIDSQHLYLFLGMSVVVGQGIASVRHDAAAVHFRHYRQAVRANPHAAHLLDVRQFAHLVEQRGVCHFKHRRIVPFAFVPQFKAAAAHAIDVSRVYRQIVFVDFYLIAFASFDSLSRKKLFGLFYAEWAIFFVSKCNAVAVAFFYFLKIRSLLFSVRVLCLQTHAQQARE